MVMTSSQREMVLAWFPQLLRWRKPYLGTSVWYDEYSLSVGHDL